MANFIKQAIKRPGALTAKAKAAGQTVDEFARAHQHDKGQTGDEARFYLSVLKPATKATKAAPTPAPKTAAKAVPVDVEDAADVASEPAGEPANEKPARSEREAATRFIAKRNK